MLKKFLRIIIILAIIIMMSGIPIIAADVQNVAITATPIVSGGLTGFTVIYVNDQQLDFTWGFIPPATNIMIRAKYGEYPHDIPNSLTAPSDGYLVYYGSATSCSDTSVDFNENASTLYIKAWAQKADGHWYLTPSTGNQEAIGVIFIGLVLLCIGLSVLLFKFPNYLLSIVSAGSWVALIPYLVANPFSSITSGSTTQQTLILVFAGSAMAMLLMGILRTISKSREIEAEIEYYGSNIDNVEPRNYKAYQTAVKRVNNPTMESERQYKERVHRTLHHKNTARVRVRGI